MSGYVLGALVTVIVVVGGSLLFLVTAPFREQGRRLHEDDPNPPSVRTGPVYDLFAPKDEPATVQNITINIEATGDTGSEIDRIIDESLKRGDD